MSWCKARGIVLDCTVPYSPPQLNETTERLNRTLMDRTRALLNDSGMEKEMWGEAIQTSTYLINRSPSETVEKTPAEVWNGKKPDLSKVRFYK